MRTQALLVLGVCVLGCDGPTASVFMTDARVVRDPARRAVVDVDLLGRESLGESAGTYCLTVTFPDQPAPVVECKSDLADGDKRTARFVSDREPKPGANIAIILRHDLEVSRRDLATPP